MKGKKAKGRLNRENELPVGEVTSLTMQRWR